MAIALLPHMDFLHSPLKIGPRTATNRLANQPMECNDADELGNPTDVTRARYRKLAEGGAGIIFLEACTITRESRARINQLGIYEETASCLEKLIREMKAINRGSLILLQITHSGRESGPAFSRVVSAYTGTDPRVHMLTANEIENIGDAFSRAAVIAEQVGADGIDFKQCHGYLCAELLRPANTRADRFGGSFENRVRFFTETVQKIRQAVRNPSFLLGARFSVYEGIPGGFGTSGPDEVTEDLTEPLRLARLMENAGLHFINVSAGIPTMTPEITRPTRNYPEGVYRHFGWAKAVKEAVGIPVIGSGYSYLRDGQNQLKDPDPRKRSLVYFAEKNLRQGFCDLVGIGRQSMADPLIARKILEGRDSEINYCRACGNCTALLVAQAPTGCPVYNAFYRNLLQGREKSGPLPK